jgi:hypothetical protein
LSSVKAVLGMYDLEMGYMVVVAAQWDVVQYLTKLKVVFFPVVFGL